MVLPSAFVLKKEGALIRGGALNTENTVYKGEREMETKKTS